MILRLYIVRVLKMDKLMHLVEDPTMKSRGKPLNQQS
jgi:hypothetical protein